VPYHIDQLEGMVLLEIAQTALATLRANLYSPRDKRIGRRLVAVRDQRDDIHQVGHATSVNELREAN
jgi:hypothetical protein